MIRRVIISMLAASTLTAAAAQKRPDAPKLNPERTVILDDIILPQTTDMLVNTLYSFTANKGEVSILIDSMGGSVGQGLRIIRAMAAVKASGSTISCVITGPTASMAAWIYLHCDNRYILPDQAVLFHFSRVILPANTAITGSDLVQILGQLSEIDKAMFADVQKYLPIKPQLMMMAMSMEIWIKTTDFEQATEDNFSTTLIPSKKLLALLKDTNVTRASKPGRPRNQMSNLQDPSNLE